MSAGYVRKLSRVWLREKAVVNFYDTVNVDHNPTDMVWVTAQFFANQKEGLIGCDGYTEIGIIDLIFMAKAGIGDDLIVSSAEQTVVGFMQSSDPAKKLTLTGYEEVREMSNGDAPHWYRIGVGVNYSYSM